MMASWPDFVAAVGEVQKHARVAIVHGGGKEIGELHGQLGIAFEFVEGLRVTSADSLRLVKMVLSGQVNTRLTRWLVNGGIDALGMSGVDLGLVRVEPLRPAGWTSVLSVASSVFGLNRCTCCWPTASSRSSRPSLWAWTASPITSTPTRWPAALAVGLGAGRLIFVSNVPGVLIDGALAPQLSIANVEAHIASGQISGGMVPKVRSAIEAVQAGVPATVITNLDGLRFGRGTVIGDR